MTCTQCSPSRINGVFCHESGCRYENARYDKESCSWVRQYTCRECGYEVDEGETCSCYDDVESFYEDSEDSL